MPRYVILVTGPSSGFGESAAEALAKAGYTVHASFRGMAGKKAKLVVEYGE